MKQKPIREKKQEVAQKIQEHKSIGLQSFETAEYINPPNSITFFRILLLGSIYTLLTNGEYLWALINIIICFYTDWLDGYMARKYNQITEFGAKFDPTADKILNIGVLLLSLNSGKIFHHELLVINNIYTITIIESILLITAWIIKPILTSYGWEKKLGSNQFGKWKMGFESATIILAIIYLAQWLEFINEYIRILAEYTLDITIILGILSIIGHYSLTNNQPKPLTTT